MLLQDLVAAAPEATLQDAAQLDITDIVMDSRKVTPGCLFVCLVGHASDGHAYAAQAVEAGAAALLVQRPVEAAGGVPQVVAPDTRRAWAQMCAAFYGYPARKLRLVGVTGTNGKTTTATLIKGVLEFAGYKVGMMGTVANYVGQEKLPQSLTTPDPMELHALLRRMADAGCDFAVMEVSAHALALHKVEGLVYDVAVFTNLTQDHLDDFQTMEKYASAKALLFQDDCCRCAVVNGEDPATERMIAAFHGPVVRYGQSPACGVRALERQESLQGLRYVLLAMGSQMPVRLQLGGAFNVYNSLAAAGACLQLGLSMRMVAEGLAQVPCVDGRIQRVETGTDYTVIVDYAHSPDGLKSILESLRPQTAGRLICVFGCGGDRDRTKRPIMGHIATTLADLVFLTSDNPRTEDPDAILDMIEQGVNREGAPIRRLADRAAAIGAALDEAAPGDVVLIAGKGHETYQDVMGVKHHFDDREVVQQHLGR